MIPFSRLPILRLFPREETLSMIATLCDRAVEYEYVCHPDAGWPVTKAWIGRQRCLANRRPAMLRSDSLSASRAGNGGEELDLAGSGEGQHDR
ncbi:hypothetical protein FRACA_2050007 [Frankia canadensis]|uniref:Uncharacterized protein n=1 Tax=Frankia canadensis TaxID=1836972 RepID=A0A2I2KQD9_9ACTN|nr:hypothetical protein FRACA_2050007 [Frankia canadensis]SOU55159.1 hypothetical protein FRACA_2050007 [Frankia canadensis]